MSQPFARADVTLANWREWPFNQWSFGHVSELIPCAVLGSGVESATDSPGDAALRGIAIDYPVGAGRVSAIEHLSTSHADCFVALKDGRIVAEWSAPHGSTVAPHLIFSITKSVTGMLAGIAAGDGALDPDAPVSDYVEVRPGSAYADCRVRHLLDMSVSLDFVENYLDKAGPFDRYRRAMLWNPQRPDAPAETMRQVLADLPRATRAHGDIFYYASPDTDMMGLVLEAATGRRWSDYLAERLWTPMGARGPALVTVDSVGSARAAGGLSVTARDLARFGQLVLDDGVAPDGRRLIPSSWIADMRTGGDQRAWLAGDFKADFPNGNYRSYWYAAGDANGSFCGIGIHGQWLWCDPARRVVLVKFSSRPLPTDDDSTHKEIAALSQVANAL